MKIKSIAVIRVVHDVSHLSPTIGGSEMEAHAGSGKCVLDNLSIDELVELRDYLQTAVEIRAYSKHLPKPTLTLVSDDDCGCAFDEACGNCEGFKL